MIEVYNNLFVGTTSVCRHDQDNEFAVIHACKTPCHQKKLGYTGSLSPSHPHYLIHEAGNHLYLNVVDMDRILPKFADPIFSKAIKFIDANIVGKNVIVHCNLGKSRSPAIALVYMARSGIISNESYQNAVSDFRKRYPGYNPGLGINNYLQNNWEKLI